MSQRPDLNQLSADQLRALVTDLFDRVENKDRALVHRDAVIEKLTHEVAILKRHKFARRSEQLDAVQGRLLDELIDSDIAAIEAELAQLTAAETPPKPKIQPKRAPLPPELPRTLIHHEPENTQCRCGCQLKRIGEDVSEKLDYVPGEFTVERHIRGKWACEQCETLTQAPVPPQVINKGIPTAGLLAQVLVAKYSDHLPLYRQERIFGRAGLAIPRSTLAEWVGACGVQLQPLVNALRNALLEHGVLHADETPVSMLAPGKKKTHKAYVWAYCTTPFSNLKAVVYDFAPTRAGEHARTFLEGWQGKLVCDDYSGYKAGFGNGITEIGCMAHARRKFYDLHQANQSQIAAQALEYIGQLYQIEREAKDLPPDKRQQIRNEKARPIADALHQWMLAHRQKVPDGSGTARALDYSLKRWTALTRYLDDGAVPIDNNWMENQIRPWALGRSNWLFAGSLRSGQRAAAVMTLIQSAKLNGHDPYAYLKDVLTKLPTQKNNAIDELLPHNWRPVSISKV
ncbi:MULTISPECIES: IS66 family transposase [Marinobacter]|uniref:IS66 family transposase n=1 Tax=Marinobacter xiaoshiensis TaxID=3073652 RepID=A0ABU2HHK5_9GAMM|nr:MULTISPECIES: IS66 family transposase [unclassified Marinobacter]MBK1888392.1 IS66 family transposase [Marinobacter sp. DY40_1A1]MDS1309235.1 IS66 family transposase [Marinobacter sp. F60267]MDS1309959.1 IS66 family transposase [Marinobacter sp. F60267]MDS1310549.1 IS66 family transposase [Marinobacter sp. F60267]MDS1310692.1 IS66 family transposase [Marinobacter sp. F60267]